MKIKRAKDTWLTSDYNCLLDVKFYRQQFVWNLELAGLTENFLSWMLYSIGL